MGIFCNRELIDSVRDISLPISKNDLISYVSTKDSISEASWISLNKLEDKVYGSFDEICENIKIICSLELREALSEVDFPVTKKDLLDYARFRNFSEPVGESINELPDDFLFRSITDICK